MYGERGKNRRIVIQYVVLTLVAYPVFYEFTSVTFKSLLPLIDTFVAADAAPQIPGIPHLIFHCLGVQ